MARFAMWRLRTTGERLRLILAAGAAVLAALTLVLLFVGPDRARGGDAGSRGMPAAFGAPGSASPTPRAGVHATAGRPSRTAGRTTAAAPTTRVTTRAVPSAAPRTFAVTLEAEAAQLGGVAAVLGCDCSGGSAIGQLGSGFVGGSQWRSGWLTFDGIAAPAAGEYQLTVSYRANRDRDLRISVSGGSTVTVRCPAGAARTVTTKVRLTAGANTLRLFNDYARAPDVDKIALTSRGR